MNDEVDVGGGGEGQNLNWVPVNNQFLPEPLGIYQREGRNGILVDTTDFNVIDYFELFFHDNLYETIAKETNLYAEQFFDNPVDVSQKSRFNDWKETSKEEIQSFLGLEIGMTLCQKPSVESYWSQYWLNATPAYGQVMPRKRYEILKSFLHFNNNENYISRGEENYDPLFKIRPILNEVDSTLDTVYQPACELSLDESMLLFKGRIAYKQYTPNKPIKWGLKEYVLAEAKTGYVLRHLPYVGKYTIPDNNDESLATEKVVFELCKNYENKGYKVYLDNFYNSPKLCQNMKQRGIGVCGTVRANRKGFPQELKTMVLRKSDPPVFRQCGNLLACSWEDRKRVNMVSTISTNTTEQKEVSVTYRGTKNQKQDS